MTTKRNQRFTYSCNLEELNLLADIAEILERSRSDTIRYLLREKAREMGLEPNYVFNKTNPKGE